MANQSQHGPGLIYAIAGGIGFVAFLLLMALFGLSFSPAILLGIVIAIAVWLYFQRRGADGSGAADGAAEDTRAGYAGAAPAAAGAQAGLEDDADANARRDGMTEGAGVDDIAADDDRGAGTTEAVDGASVGYRDDKSVVRPSKPLPGQAELAERKGSWKYERGGAPAGAATGAAAAGSTDGAAVDRSGDVSDADMRKTEGGAAEDAASGDVSTGADDPQAAGVGDDAEAILTPDPTPEPEIDRSAIPANGTTDIDGDAVVGTEPARLERAREGGADDLKKIKGVGPKLEAMLNKMGFYHFDQIADWSDREISWVDDNLEGFRGRVSRDNWVEQARILASGGETEFSKRSKG